MNLFMVGSDLRLHGEVKKIYLFEKIVWSYTELLGMDQKQIGILFNSGFGMECLLLHYQNSY